MLILESPKEMMVKTLAIQEMVKFRSSGWQRGRLGGWEWTWSRNEDWKWVRDRTVVFPDGLRCGDVWDLVRGVREDEIGGDRTFSLFCRWKSEEKDTVVGMSAQIQADAWYGRTWKAWLQSLCGANRQKRKKQTWSDWFRVLVGGGRKRVDGEVTNRIGPFFGEHFFCRVHRMKNNEDAVLEVTILKVCAKWKFWRWFARWKETKSSQLEKLGFEREPDPQISIT